MRFTPLQTAKRQVWIEFLWKVREKKIDLQTDMQERIRGIVLRTVKYGDSGLIVDMFTEQYGRKSFATKVVKGRRTASNSALWTPLSMVEFETTIRPNGKLPRPKDVGIYYNNVGLMFNPVKSTIALFLSEFLYHALKSETDNAPLYAYLEHSIRWLDASERTFANFHLVFLMRLTRFLGIYPNLDDCTPLSYFDLRAGGYKKSHPYHPDFLPPAEACLLPRLFRMNYDTMHLFAFSRTQRWHILSQLTHYYRLHIPGFPELKSLDVLHDVFG